MDTASVYRNTVSHVDLNRELASIEYFQCNNVEGDPRFEEFLDDINKSNDVIELSLVKNSAYKETVILSMKVMHEEKDAIRDIIASEQKTFGGSKLFYVNKELDKLLVIAVPGSMDAKLSMVVNRLNKINEKISRLNLKIKKENLDTYSHTIGNKDKKVEILNTINKQLKA